MIKITFPDKSIKEYETGITVIEIAKEISTSLAKNVIAAKFNNIIIDTSAPLTEDGSLILLTEKNKESFNILNHSTAHLMAQAIKHLYPEAKFGVGPAIDEGFYYDVDIEGTISENELLKIEKEMLKLASANYPFIRQEISFDEAEEIFKNDEYKLYLINQIKNRGETISIYTQGDFTDLCRGVHVPSTKFIKHFKLLNVAGAYWLGDTNNNVMQRIYGTSWFTKNDLEEHLNILNERKERDHRKLGKELELFTFSPETGAGLPLWLPNGSVIRYELEKFIKEEELRRGYKHVYTPVLGTKKLYETSGHWDHYQDDMFPPIETDNETFVLRPMCCPHHAMIFKNSLKSYKELPYRIAELGGLHRYEASGALTGLERVRNMCLNDAHIFLAPDQIKEEFKNVIDLVNLAIKTLKLEINYYRLSLRDPENKEKYFDDDAMWNTSESYLKEVLNELNIDYIEALDEAAFYGPKLDIQIKTALGHDITLSTIQLDFLLPQKFDLSYIGKDGKKHQPVIIHRGIISTMERMTATLIEQYKGAFPTWLAPTQVNIIPVSLKAHMNYANFIEEELRKNDIRVVIDEREEKLNYKIRDSQINKISYTLILGDNELENDSITYRLYSEKANTTLHKTDFINKIIKEAKERL